MKKIAVIPTLLTLGNAVCGFAAIAYTSKAASPVDGYYSLAGWLIFAAMVFDALDGYVARLSKTASNFGVQLDSLCDAVSFGVAPAFLVLRMGPGLELPRLHQAVAVIAALYMTCAILRLARFNVETSPDPLAAKRFRGLPSPGAAGCIASLAIFQGGLGPGWINLNPQHVYTLIKFWMPVGALLVALLMVSRLPYPHLTKQMLRGRHHFSHLVQVVLAGFILWLTSDLALVILFWFYALVLPLYGLIRGWIHSGLPSPAPRIDDPLPR
jgi:CDP-diacylglycerol--serine O-phosphatidyltransferase